MENEKREMTVADALKAIRKLSQMEQDRTAKILKLHALIKEKAPNILPDAEAIIGAVDVVVDKLT